MNNPFIILGGGIAGLCTAIALQRKGIPVEVYEGTQQMMPVGAGLTLSANAMKALQAIGLDKAVTANGNVADIFTIYDQQGRVLNRTDTQPVLKKYDVSNVAIHRAALHQVLMDQLEPGTVVFGKRSKDINIIGDGYHIEFEDGTSVDGRYLIVAEGIHSVVRKKLFPEAGIRFAGYTCWRGIVSDYGDVVNQSSETWGTEGRFGMVPVSSNQLYWFATTKALSPDSDYKFFSKKDLLHHFRDYHSPIPGVIGATPAGSIIWNDIIDLEPLRSFANGNCVLIGDAAHATTPNLGQGACLAIEDAAILAYCLEQHSIAADAFKHFESLRLKRTRSIVEASWQMGKVAEMTHPVGYRLRNALFKALPQVVFDRQIEKLFTVQPGIG